MSRRGIPDRRRVRKRMLLSAWGLCALACASSSGGHAGRETAGTIVPAPGADYTLSLPAGEWLLAESDDLEEPLPEVDIVRRDGGAWIRAWSRKERRIEEIVWDRRAALLASGAMNYRETRYFLEGSPRITASLSRYVLGSEVLLVFVALRPPYAVEAIAGGVRADGTEDELIGILESVRFVGTEEGP